MKATYAVRSALFLLLYGATVGLYGAGGQLLRLAPESRRGPALLTWNRMMLVWLRIACGVRWQLHGELPAGPYVALAKHQSQWETICLQAALYPVSVVLKRELLSIPFYGWSLALMNPVAIDRGSPKEAIRNMLRVGKSHIERGFSVLIFPEGTRTAAGQRGKYARGGAALAIESGVSILPIAHNAGRHWPTTSWIKTPGTIHVVVGELIDPAGRNSRELTGAVEEWIESTVSAIERGDYDQP